MSRNQRPTSSGWRRWATVLAVAVAVMVLAVLVRAGTSPTPNPEQGANPFAGERFYVNNPEAQRTADGWRAVGRIEDARQIEKIAEEPGVHYFAPEWSPPGTGYIREWVTLVAGQGELPVLGLYGLPHRDCGGYSAGGAGSAQAYRSWIDHASRQIGDRKVVVILEPDGVPYWECLTGAQQQERAGLIEYAVSVLKGGPETFVYIDAGHHMWHSAGVIADRLERAGIQRADGFALNTSNFMRTQDEVSYGGRKALRRGHLPQRPGSLRGRLARRRLRAADKPAGACVGVASHGRDRTPFSGRLLLAQVARAERRGMRPLPEGRDVDARVRPRPCPTGGILDKCYEQPNHSQCLLFGR
jgi:hypothetical protein